MMKVEFQIPGVKDEIEMKCVPRIGERVCFGSHMFDVIDVLHKPDLKKTIVSLIPHR